MPYRLLPLLATALTLLLASPAAAIMGGRPATEPYPWAVSLEQNGGHICGGSLVRPDWVLTAGHCVEEDKPESYTVVLGRVDLTNESEGREHAVDKAIVHEKYTSDGTHDISLLHLAEPSSQEPIRIVDESESALWSAGKPARVIGWGTSFFLVGPSPDELYEVDVPMVSDDDCESSYSFPASIAAGEFDGESMVCAGDLTGTKDSCQGDSGGPLMVKDPASKWVQVGTVSFGLGCGTPNYYGVYGRIGGPALRRWLDAHLPPVGSAPGTPAPAAPAAPAPVAPAATTAEVTLRFSAKLGSAKAARKRRLVRVRVTSTGPVTAVRAVLKRGKKTIARARMPRLDGRGTIRFPARSLKAGRLRLELVAVDAAGRTVRRAGAVRLSR